ncbi:MAG: carbohydrate kinase [Candidatus Acidiferrales bacterium]|jgi:fructokinase
MAEKNHVVVGLGEVLWDLLPAGKQLGGAPTNFAYITNLLGDRGIVASRVGNDDLGREARDTLEKLQLSTANLQLDPVHPTGTVKVQVDAAGQPKFEISENVAWDFLAWTSEWNALAREADAVCFGSLAQRSLASRKTILEFVKATRPSATRIFDVNLRQAFFSAEVLAESANSADIVKLNDDELPRVMALLGIQHRDEETSAGDLLRAFGLKLVCVTRGAKGSLLVNEAGSHRHPGYQIKVADTIGAGDAFTAALVHKYLRGAPLATMNNAANRVGSWVASQIGGTPEPSAAQLREIFIANT